MTCPYCGYKTEEIPMPRDKDLEAGQYFFEQTILAGAGHRLGDHDPYTAWLQLSEDGRRACGHAAAAFKKRFVCAG